MFCEVVGKEAEQRKVSTKYKVQNGSMSLIGSNKVTLALVTAAQAAARQVTAQRTHY
jgi:hypothetical protein